VELRIRLQKEQGAAVRANRTSKATRKPYPREHPQSSNQTYRAYPSNSSTLPLAQASSLQSIQARNQQPQSQPQPEPQTQSQSSRPRTSQPQSQESGQTQADDDINGTDPLGRFHRLWQSFHENGNVVTTGDTGLQGGLERARTVRRRGRG